MRWIRRTVCLLAVPLLLLTTPAFATRRPVSPDQYCAPVASRTGYYGATFSQSFRPRAKTVAAVDVLLISLRNQRVLPRIRLVAQRNLPSGVAVQTAVLGHQQQFVTLSAYRQTWVRLRLRAPVAVTSAGPAADQLAVQVMLPEGDDSLWWLTCDGYIGGTGRIDTDAGSVVRRDTGTAVALDLARGLAFREYATRP